MVWLRAGLQHVLPVKESQAGQNWPAPGNRAMPCYGLWAPWGGCDLGINAVADPKGTAAGNLQDLHVSPLSGKFFF